MADRIECAWALQELAEVRRGRAPAGIAARLQQHLQACSRCKSAAGWDQQLQENLARAPFPAMSASIEAEAKRRIRRRRSLQRVAIGTAAAAVIGVISLAVWEGFGNRLSPSTIVASNKHEPTHQVLEDVGQQWDNSPVANIGAKQNMFLAALEAEIAEAKRK